MSTATDAMTATKICDNSPAYRAEIDSVEEQSWYQILREFDDANLYQTWAYGLVRYGRRKMSHLILKKNGTVTAAAQVRIEKLPFINLGIAYVQWGPLCMVRGTEPDVETFRQVLRALRNEYVFKRGLVLRLFPNVFEDDGGRFLKILEEEGFSLHKEVRKRTILMDLSLSLDDLRGSMQKRWKRNLTLAEKHGLEVLEGSEDDLFKTVVDIHKEMVARKNFVPGSDIRQFQSIQALLPEEFKMKVLVGRSKEGVCAGLICSAIGRTAIYLHGATSNAGMKSRGSYLLHWKLIEKLRQRRVAIYNLNGINPIKNPGTYTFKSGLAGQSGRDVLYIGRFDSRAGLLGYSFIELGDKFRALLWKVRGFTKQVFPLNWQGSAAK